MTPTEVVKRWIVAFNQADIDGLMALYADDAVNEQVVTTPLKGRDAIRKLFEVDFSRAKMVCIEQRIYACGDTAILQWEDPLGLQGCGFFEVHDGKIVYQKGYFDQLSFFKVQGIPIPPDYLTS